MRLANLLMYQRRIAYKKNLNNILDLTEMNQKAKILDLGCDDGVWTKKVANKIKSRNVFGLDLIKKQVKKAIKNGVKAMSGNLNVKLPYKSGYFDVVHANQVIEHVVDTDLFVSGVYRVLKKGGYALISTENLASWHNIFALFLGYMPFSLTNASSKTGALGNPLDKNHTEKFSWLASSWQHQRVFTTKGWSHLFKLYFFKIEKILGAGYYPLGNLLSNFDISHSAFITFKIRKI